MVRPLGDLFSRLAKGGYTITSQIDKKYNCIAFAAGDMKRWWWPLPADVQEVFWPANAPRVESLAAFRDAFASLGFCDCDNDDVEPGFAKIALFANPEGIPLHAARQLPDGRWTSKIGEREDIEHELRDLEGSAYGTVKLLMRKRLPTQE
jgi:hypothetical protein